MIKWPMSRDGNNAYFPPESKRGYSSIMEKPRELHGDPESRRPRQHSPDILVLKTWGLCFFLSEFNDSLIEHPFLICAFLVHAFVAALVCPRESCQEGMELCGKAPWATLLHQGAREAWSLPYSPHPGSWCEQLAVPSTACHCHPTPPKQQIYQTLDMYPQKT